MNRMSKLATIGILLLVSMTLCVSADGTYSTHEDPLVSLSYVNNVLGPQIMEQVLAKIDAEYVKISDISMASAGSYTTLALTQGQTVMADACCEVVLVSGMASAVITAAANVEAGNGISDLTDGAVLVNSNLLPLNHYLVIPKSDGRGFTVTSETATILIRGEYHVAG